jgi:hypothetical protein
MRNVSLKIIFQKYNEHPVVLITKSYKVKFPIEKAMKTQRRSRGITLLFL